MCPLVQDATGNDLTYRIIGAAMAVHNTLGPGHREHVYERALAIELERRDISVEAQVPVEVVYEGTPAALLILDLYVERRVVIELKAVTHPLTDDDLAQLLGYLKASSAEVGLLFNFGRRRLETRRVFPPPGPTPPSPRTARDNVIKPPR